VLVWPIVRNELMFSLSAEDDAGTRPARRFSVLGSGRAFLEQHLGTVATVARMHMADRAGRARPDARADLVFLTHSTCRVLLGPSWVDMFSDPLADALEARGMRCAALEFLVGGEARFPRYRASQLVDAETAGAKLRAALDPRVWRKNEEHDAMFRRLAEVLTELGLGQYAVDRRAIVARTLAIAGMARVFERALKRSGARVGGVVTWYHLEGMAFCMACHRVGIPVFDLQHGTQGHHGAYARWTRVPANGYALMPSHFWVWREEERAEINRWAASVFGEDRAFVGGNLWLSATGRPSSKLAEYDRELRAECGARPNRKVVLVSLQDGRFAPSDEFARALATAPPECEFWLRLHPSMQRTREQVRGLFRVALRDRFELDRATDWPLPVLLRYSDAHVTLCSSVVIEAALVGVPSIVMDPVGVELFDAEVRAGLAKAACEPGNLASVLTEVIRGGRRLDRVTAPETGIVVVQTLAGNRTSI
jgi:hypothetical protein